MSPASKDLRQKTAHGMPHYNGALLESCYFGFKVGSIFQEAGCSQAWVRKTCGIHVMKTQRRRNTSIAFLLKKFPVIIPAPGPNHHSMYHEYCVTHSSLNKGVKSLSLTLGCLLRCAIRSVKDKNLPLTCMIRNSFLLYETGKTWYT